MTGGGGRRTAISTPLGACLTAGLLAASACSMLTAQQVAQLDQWRGVAASSCAALGHDCPRERLCVAAANAAQGAAGSYEDAATACGNLP